MDIAINKIDVDYIDEGKGTPVLFLQGWGTEIGLYQRVFEKIKQKNRIIAFDQATERFGLSIFDDGKLVFYSLYTFSGGMVQRLVKIKKFVRDIVIKE